VTSFGPAALPIPDGGRVRLIMKETLEEHDDHYKSVTYDALRSIGTVVAAFDNEPTHINGYRASFPHAICVHLATDHSGRPVRVADGIVSIRDFASYRGA
jgi:hypothetical protein